jgi:sugar (pentulose or hexulose) kinase
MPRSYRDDAFNEENMAEAIEFLGGKSWLFHQTYLANLEINPVFQLYRMKKLGEGALESAGTLLMMPNLIEYFLTGVKHSEYTAVATSQLYNMKQKCWAKPLIDKLRLPDSLFTQVDLAGKNIGTLSPAVAGETGHTALKVISVAGHDTASAIMAAPSVSQEFMYLSSGTWSLMGFCSDRLLEDEFIIPHKIANEGVWDGGYRSNINISGLWILQECQKQWNTEGKKFSFNDLDTMAQQAKPLQSLIRPDDFEKIGNYPEMIRTFCKKTGQRVPEQPGEMVRCILESLALKYRQVYDVLKPYIHHGDALYIVGGGVRNRLLNQCTANAMNLPVITGPSEATVVGNVLVQLEAQGEVHGAEQRREIIRNSFESEEFLPKDPEIWEEAYSRFTKLYQ